MKMKLKNLEAEIRDPQKEEGMEEKMYRINIYDPNEIEIKKIDGKWKPVTVRKLINHLTGSLEFCQEEAEFHKTENDGFEIEIEMEG